MATKPRVPPLIPPFRFACVERGVYRGAYPSLKNLRYLARLKLRTVISLIPDASAPSEDLAGFCSSHNIRHIARTVAKYNDGFSHTAELVADVLAQVFDPANHPLFLHCLDGRHNTGIVIMCLRKLQNWGLPAILNEFARYTKDSSFQYGEQQFVQAFSATVAFPSVVPDWFASRVEYASDSDTSTSRPALADCSTVPNADAELGALSKV